MLLLGGSAVINALTGMNIYAAAFLIPIGVILYTAIGGLKATFMSSYIHTVRTPTDPSALSRSGSKLSVAGILADCERRPSDVNHLPAAHRQALC